MFPYLGFWMKLLHYSYNPGCVEVTSFFKGAFKDMMKVSLERYLTVPVSEQRKYDDIMRNVKKEDIDIVSMGLNTGRGSYDELTKLKLISYGLSQDVFFSIPDYIANDIVQGKSTKADLIPLKEIIEIALKDYKEEKWAQRLSDNLLIS